MNVDDECQPCPECGVWYLVVWNNDGFSVPEFCPFCGWEITDDE